MKRNNTLIILLIAIIFFISNSRGQIGSQHLGGSAGQSSEYLSCSNDCNYNGYCRYGKCNCYQGWTGNECQTLILSQTPSNTPSTTSSYFLCTNNCNYNGDCIYGECYCYQGWSGNECKIRNNSYPSPTPSGTTSSYFSCPNNCNYNGNCIMGTCECAPGYSGNECQYSDNQKVICEYTSKGISIRSDFKEVVCTIKGEGFCIDSLTQLKCKSKGYYSEVECTILMSFGHYTNVQCEANNVECISEYAVCSVKNSQFHVNNILQTEKNVEILATSDSKSLSPSSSTSSSSICSINNLIFFIIATLSLIVNI